MERNKVRINLMASKSVFIVSSLILILRVYLTLDTLVDIKVPRVMMKVKLNFHDHIFLFAFIL